MVVNRDNLKNIPETGFMRLSEILQFVPIGKSSWWAGVKNGRFPQSLKLGPRTTVWRCEDIRSLLVDPCSGEG